MKKYIRSERTNLFEPPKVSYAKKVIGISTYADKLSVCYHKIKNKI